jgi:hypothetical protein
MLSRGLVKSPGARARFDEMIDGRMLPPDLVPDMIDATVRSLGEEVTTLPEAATVNASHGPDKS